MPTVTYSQKHQASDVFLPQSTSLCSWQLALGCFTPCDCLDCMMQLSDTFISLIHTRVGDGGNARDRKGNSALL